MDLTTFRIKEKNNINTSIKEKKLYIKRSTETIDRLKRDNTNITFNKNQIAKLNDRINELNDEIKVLENNLVKLENGSFDQQMIKEGNETRDKINLAFKNKLISTREKATDKKEVEGKHLQKSYDIVNNRSNKEPTQRDMDRELKYFNKICDSIPDYITKNLSEMPSNKGYIWKGVWCFGNLPPEKNQPLIMFEKLRDSNKLRIIEIDETHRTIYEKEGKNRKILVSKTPRNPEILNETKRLLSLVL